MHRHVQRSLICSVASFILDLNGIQFAIQLVLLIIIGPYADYGTWRPYILICGYTFLLPCYTDTRSLYSHLLGH